MTTGHWAEPDFPHKGWVIEGIYDLLKIQVCEMCKVQPIRYGYDMYHPATGRRLFWVGCDCAEHMSSDYKKPKELRRQLDAAQRFATLKQWRPTKSGSGIWRKREGVRVFVIQRGQVWVVGVAKDGRETRWGDKRYKTQREARIAAYTAYQWSCAKSVA